MADASGISNGQTAQESNFTGIIWPYAGGGVPTGFLLCDGSAVSRTTYARLFGVISTSYGAGDGSTTFNVPDGRGRTLIGAGTGTKIATFASRASNVITVTGPTNAANNEFQTGQAVVYASTGTDIGGLTSSTTYYVIRTGNLTFSLATTLANAQKGTAITLSSDGTGTRSFTQTLTARSRGDTGGEENHAMSTTELVAHTHTITTTVTAGGTTGNVTSNSGSDNTATTNSTGGNTAMNDMPPFVAVNWIIKT